jgi:hypothetical protein
MNRDVIDPINLAELFKVYIPPFTVQSLKSGFLHFRGCFLLREQDNPREALYPFLCYKQQIRQFS